MQVNKGLYALIALMLSVSLVGCGASDAPDTTNNDGEAPQATQEAPVEKKAVIEDVEDIGEGECYLTGPGGDTKEGDTVQFFSSPDTVMMDIGIGAEGMDGSKLSYIYVDGNLVQKEQMGEYQGGITLKDNLLDPGVHQVIVKQYDDNTENGTVVYQHAMQYEIINK